MGNVLGFALQPYHKEVKPAGERIRPAVEQHARVELAQAVWKTAMLPLHQCCVYAASVRGMVGFRLSHSPEPFIDQLMSALPGLGS